MKLGLWAVRGAGTCCPSRPECPTRDQVSAQETCLEQWPRRLRSLLPEKHQSEKMPLSAAYCLTCPGGTRGCKAEAFKADTRMPTNGHKCQTSARFQAPSRVQHPCTRLLMPLLLPHLSLRACEALKLSHWSFYCSNPAVGLDTKGEVLSPITPLVNVLLKTNNWNQA